MNKLKFLFSKTLLYYVWQEFWVRWHFKFVVPKIARIQIDDVHLDVSKLPPKARHRLLYVGYETEEKQMCCDFLDRNDSVLELGAAIGYIGLYCQKKLGIRNYVLVEANPRTLGVLKRNYELNGLTPNVLNFALASENGQIDLNVETDFWENSILPSDASNGRKTMQVPAATLDMLIAAAGVTFNTMIIDVEGAEQFIDFKNLPDSVEKIIIELHPHLIGPEKTYDIVSSVVSRGFRVVREQSGTFAFLKSPVKAQLSPQPAAPASDRSGIRRSAAWDSPTNAPKPVGSAVP